MRSSKWVLTALLALTAVPLSAHETKIGHLVLDHAWSRASVGTMRPGVVYLTIKNTGAAPDRLVAAKTPRAARVGLHRSLMEGGIMKMKHVDAITIPAGGTVALKPGGYHLMLMGLKAPLEAGEDLPVTLTFELAGKITVMAKINKLGGGKMKHMNHGPAH